MSTETTLDEVKRFIELEKSSEVIEEDLKTTIQRFISSEAGKNIINRARRGALERLGNEAETGGQDIVSGAANTLRRLLRPPTNPKKK